VSLQEETEAAISRFLSARSEMRRAASAAVDMLLANSGDALRCADRRRVVELKRELHQFDAARRRWKQP
jgi:hypothetical protein